MKLSSALLSSSFVLLLALAACTPSHNGPSRPPAAASQTPTVSQTTGGDQTAALSAPTVALSPAEASQLRETAAGVLTTAASTPSKDPAQSALRANAFEGLLPMPGRLEPILRIAFTDNSIGIRSVAAMAAGKAKIKGLVDALQPLTADESPLVHASAVFALQRCGASADPTILASMLAGHDTQQRALAAFILGELGNKSAIPMLVATATQPSPSMGIRDKLMRLQIAEALVKLGKADAIDEIRAALYPATSDEIEATALAVQIIGQVRDIDSSAQLQNLIADGYKSSNPMPIEIRLAAASGLARFGHPKAGPFALTYVKDPSAPIRAQAAAAIGETHDAKYLASLAPLLTDPDLQVRIASAAAVIKITDGR